MLAFKNNQPVTGLELNDRAFHYGDGGFSTANVVYGAIQLKQRHRQRLMHLIEALKLNCDVTRINDAFDFIEHQISGAHGSLKIILSRGVGPRGYALPQTQADLYLLFFPSEDARLPVCRTIDCTTLSQRLSLQPTHIRGLKTLNRLEQVMLKDELDQTNCSEGFCFDLNEALVEGVMGNCFVYLAGQWYTPDLSHNGIAGVMRAEILSRMELRGIACQVTEINQRMLENAQSAFFCNALNAMQAVNMLNSRALQLEPCQALFQQLELDQLV